LPNRTEQRWPVEENKRKKHITEGCRGGTILLTDSWLKGNKYYNPGAISSQHHYIH